MLLLPTLFCPKSWESMSGDETRRFCAYCKKHVHNLETLSVSERVALLSSPAASICSRYQIAIRRPVPGKEVSYSRHLLKHGAAVALVGTVLLVLWEMQEEGSPQRFYRVGGSNGVSVDMPNDLFEECRTVVLGDIAPAIEPVPTVSDSITKSHPPSHIDLRLDPNEVDRLLGQFKPTIVAPQTDLPRGPK
ncbi:MAG: hypothetical protein HY302_07895 [Opitutae bacterium]|nr:hypothetical protein [Opitutae bacterium]